MLRANLQEIIDEKAAWHDFVNEDLRHIRRLIIEYGRRLQVLQLAEARKGFDIAPDIILEIQDIRTKIEELRAKLRTSEVRTDFLIGLTE